MFTRTLTALIGGLWTVLLVQVPLLAMQPPGGAATDGFVPLDSLPPVSMSRPLPRSSTSGRRTSSRWRPV